jgi:hypothetical protein
MITMSFDEIRAKPEKLDLFFKDGKAVTVTKDGKPYFEAIPTHKSALGNDFDRKVDALWAGSGIEYSTEQVVRAIRESRE